MGISRIEVEAIVAEHSGRASGLLLQAGGAGCRSGCYILKIPHPALRATFSRREKVLH
jgi:hypothetical protein